jgi:hypothetical protein
MMIMKGPALYIDALNPACLRLLATEDAQQHPFEEILSREPWLVEGVRQSYRDDKVWTSEPRKIAFRAGPDAGQQRTVVFTAVPTHEDGKVDGVVLYGEDVTGPPHA